MPPVLAEFRRRYWEEQEAAAEAGGPLRLAPGFPDIPERGSWGELCGVRVFD